jgi:arylsulfatase
MSCTSCSTTWATQRWGRTAAVGRGFERFYGFLGAETNQWYPDLVYDNHPVEQPRSPEEGYHLTEDLTNKALEFIRDAQAVALDKPFFLYYCPGACHAPHHAPKEWIEKYRGKFDMGYEAYREQVFERQKRMGVITDKAELSPINPYADATSTDGKSWPELDTVRPWDSLTDDEKRLFCRMAEVYAGFLSHADHEIGRLLDHLEQSGQLDNTIIVLVSDNGASGEGGPNGSVNENKLFNGITDTIEANLRIWTSWAARRPTTTTRPGGRGSVATPCTSRTASSNTSTTSSAIRCRSSSRPNRCRPAARSCRPPSSARVTPCPPRAP